MEMRVEIVIQLIVALFMGFLGIILKGIKDDVTTIRQERANDQKTLISHIQDHIAHCKHPTKGC